MNFRKPDVVINTKDWESVERFLCNVEPDKTAGLRETHKYHVRIVLQSGERWYLNLLVSETDPGSRRTARVKNEGKNGEALGDSPGGITGPAQLWECVDLIICRDNQDRRPEKGTTSR